MQHVLCNWTSNESLLPSLNNKPFTCIPDQTWEQEKHFWAFHELWLLGKILFFWILGVMEHYLCCKILRTSPSTQYILLSYLSLAHYYCNCISPSIRKQRCALKIYGTKLISQISRKHTVLKSSNGFRKMMPPLQEIWIKSPFFKESLKL